MSDVTDGGAYDIWPTATIHRALQHIVGSAHVFDSGDKLAVLDVARAGEGNRGKSPPVWRVQPNSPAEVAELISLANHHRMSVIPVGNLSRTPRLELGRERAQTRDPAAADARMRLFVDTRRMDHVLRLDETSLLVHVQAGLTGSGLEKILAPRRLSVGDYPPSVMRSTLGGVLSVRTPGKSSARHGFVENAVLGVSAVLADGRTVHTRVAPRRATGPDVARALCGSEGTIGFITSLVLRVHRIPETRFLSAYALPDFDAALSVVHLSLREEAEPAALRAYDSAAAQVRLRPGVCEPGESVLVVATAGPTDLAACDRDLIASAAEAMGGRALDNEIASIWWHRRMGRSEMPHPPPPQVLVTAAPSQQKRLYRAVCAAVADVALDDSGRTPLIRTHAARFDRDGAVLFFTFEERDSGQLLAGDALRVVAARAEAAARETGGVPLAAEEPSQSELLDELRRQLDPNGIMNPDALRTRASAAASSSSS